MIRPVSPAIAAMRATRGGPWRPPTRRAFLAMLGLGGGVLLARRDVVAGVRPVPRPAARWIGHT